VDARPCSCVAIFICIVALSSTYTYAQHLSCPVTYVMRATPGPTGYGPRSDSDRCEGLVEPQVAGGGLRLVSLTWGRIDYDLQRDKNVVLSPFKSELSLSGRGISAGIQYRLDARLQPQKDFLLPLEPVLKAVGIEATDLGLLAFREDPGGNSSVYVPLHVTPSSPSANDGVIALLRTESDLRDVQWRLVNGESPPFQPGHDAQGLVVAGQPIELDLPKVNEQFSGNLQVQYRDLQGETYLLTVAIAGQ
jgi:hypothetical protein